MAANLYIRVRVARFYPPDRTVLEDIAVVLSRSQDRGHRLQRQW